jgi:N-acetylmuramoyl-L-alanine amidase
VVSSSGKDGFIFQAPGGVPINPVSVSPVSVSPMTVNPVTVNPVTVSPMTVNPVSVSPMTVNPVTVSPMTVNPTTVNPVTASPTAIDPATANPAQTAPAANNPTPAGKAAGNTAPKTAVSIWVNGERVTLASLPLLLKGTTYVPLYDFCRLMGSAAMTQDENSATIFLPDLQIEATADNFYIIANGRYLYAPGLCKMVDNVMYVPIRPLVKAFGSAITWDQPSRTIYISQNYKPIERGDTFYDKTDLHWLSRIISAEARGECMDGKIAVGNVVLNRVHSASFPKTVHGVVFDRRSGVQFSPAYSGAINRTPDSSCVIAAKLALDGANIVGESLYFNASRLRSTWASRNRTFVATIGNHSFYA